VAIIKCRRDHSEKTRKKQKTKRMKKEKDFRIYHENWSAGAQEKRGGGKKGGEVGQKTEGVGDRGVLV